MSETKKCSKCSATLNVLCFYKDSLNSSGYSSSCKQCKSQSHKELINKRKIRIIEYPDEKTCTKCKETKLISEFSKNKSTTDGVSLYCKLCRRLNDENRKENAKNNIINVNKLIVKKCSKCNIEKSLIDFRINRKSQDNMSHMCLECLPKNNWTKEKQRISEKKYRTNNPEKMKEKYKKQGQNINRRIRDSINHRIKDALFSKNLKKIKKTNEYLNCSTEYFKLWIESQFVENMTWENYGEWHFDHVKPCASYNLSLENDVKECFCWENFQPLWGPENISKSSKIDNDLINEHKQKVFNFKINNIDISFNSAQVKEGELLEQLESLNNHNMIGNNECDGFENV